MPDCERTSIISELTPPFLIKHPVSQTSPVVFCSPHSGRIYPAAFIAVSQLTPQQLRKSEDCYVDELFAAAPKFGSPLIMARFPRAYIDVNREPYELDPALFAEPLPKFANINTARVTAGLGTIARIVSPSEEIYAERLSLHVGLERIERLYMPFHSALHELIENTRRKFGFAVLIDCHSMPSSSSSHPTIERPNFVIGDRFGTSCDKRLTHMICKSLAQIGWRIQLNRPYAGGFITERYGKPERNVHAIQVEINRSLYLKESTLERSIHFSRFQDKISIFSEAIVSQIARLMTWRDAAE